MSRTVQTRCARALPGPSVAAIAAVVAAVLASAGPAAAIERNCPRGQVWDPNQGSCVKKQRARRRSPAQKYYLAVQHLEGTARRASPERGVTLLEQACRDRHAGACTLLGFLYKSGRHVAFDADKSLSYYERACAMRDTQGCLGAADVHARGLRGEVEHARAQPLLERACDLDSGKGCYQLAAAYDNALGVAADKDRARALYARAFRLLEADCTSGVGPSCHLLGMAKKQGHGAARDLTAAFRDFEKGCRAGSGEACYEVGNAYELGTGVAQSYDKAFATYMNACRRYDSAESCHDAGVAMAQGHIRGGAIDQQLLTELGQRACDLDKRQCDLIGHIYGTGKGGEQDDVKAASWYLVACEHGSAVSCSASGHRAETGSGVAKDPARAVKLWQRACDGGHAGACKEVARRYFEGVYVTQDRRRAFELFHLACVRRDAQACHFAAEQLADGTDGSGESKPDRAKPYYEESCRQGRSIACAVIGDFYKAGDKGFAKDPDQALAYYGKACDMGYHVGCTDLGQLHYRGEGVEKDLVAAARAFTRACAAGATQACYWIDSTLAQAGAPPGEAKEALAQLTRACDGGAGKDRNEHACLALGGIYAYGGALAKKDGRRGFGIFRDGCERKFHNACVEMAQCYSFGVGVVEDRDRAQTLLKDLCDGEAPVACYLLASLLWREKDFAGSARLARRACEEGDARACNLVGFSHYTAQGSRWDIGEAVTHYEKGCELGEPIACANVGELYEFGIGKDEDLERALELYQKGCTPTAPVACGRLGRFYQEGLGGADRDLARARREYQRACDAESAQACRALANMLRKSDDADPSEVAALVQRAVSLATEQAEDNPYGRYLMGLMYRDGFGVVADPSKALAYFEQACDGYDPLGCISAGDMLIGGTGVDPAPLRAAARFDRACAARVQQACVRAKQARAANAGTAAEVPRAPRSKRGCACRAGDSAPTAGWLLTVGGVAFVALRRRAS